MSTSAKAVREWVTVPRIPTDAMLLAAQRARLNDPMRRTTSMWRAMLEAAPRSPAAHPAITHCDNCGCDWLDNGLNPIGCPYCKQSEYEHANAALQAEIEALRAEVAEARDGWRMANGTADLAMKHRDEAEASAERLAKVLRLAEEHINDLTPEWYSAGQRVLAEIRAALAQEDRND